MRRLLILAALGLGLLVPQVASAGCVAQSGGNPFQYPDSHGTFVASADAVHCTTSNGIVYELRSYIQTDTGGTWHIETTAAKHQIYNAGKPIANGYNHTYVDFFSCDQFPIAGLRWRAKLVLENAVTNSVSVVYSAPAAKTCHA